MKGKNDGEKDDEQYRGRAEEKESKTLRKRKEGKESKAEKGTNRK